MSGQREVRVSGELVCADEDQWHIVADHLPEHIALTRAEPGCLFFEVMPKDRSLAWEVSEGFHDEAAFRAHRVRVAGSAWARATAGIERRYVIEGLAGRTLDEGVKVVDEAVGMVDEPVEVVGGRAEHAPRSHRRPLA